MPSFWSRSIVFGLVEAIVLGERVKPIQRAIRIGLSRYNVYGSRMDRVVSGIVYNVYRSLGLLDHIIYVLTGFNVSELDVFERNALRLITYIWFLDRGRFSNKVFIRIRRYVLEYLGLKNRGSRIRYLVDRIVSSEWFPRTDDEMIMYKYRVNPMLYKVLDKALKILGEPLDVFLEHTLKPPPRVFRVNTLKKSIEEILDLLDRHGVEYVLGKYSRHAIVFPSNVPRIVLDLVEKGYLVPQDEASIVAVEILDPGPDMDIADLCAAPGGKTTYLAELSRPGSKIHAFEIYRGRAKRLLKLLKRTGAGETVIVHVMDARRALEILPRNSMDRVLVDPPCSSTGALARNPDVRWRYDEKELEKINKLQIQLLETGIELLKPGGKLLYTVCSVLPWEGEEVVEKIINEKNTVELIPLEKPFKKSPILPETQRSWPHIHNTTGFYYALLTKKP